MCFMSRTSGVWYTIQPVWVCFMVSPTCMWIIFQPHLAGRSLLVAFSACLMYLLVLIFAVSGSVCV